MGNANQLFRKKSVESIESPEDMNSYLRVTTPSIWILLGAVILLLIGVGIWGIFGTLQSSVSAAVISDANGSRVLVPKSAINAVISDHTITIDGQDYQLKPSSLQATVISEATDVYVMLAGSLSVGDVVYEIPLEETLPEGVETGTILTETIHPISFLIN